MIRPITRYEMRSVETFSGMVGVLWGLWILNPAWNSFERDPRHYLFFRAVAPEWEWGLLVLLVGSLQLRALWIDAYFWRRAASFFAFVLWCFIGLLLAESSVSSTGGPLYTLLGLFQATAFLRLKVERHKDRQADEALLSLAQAGL